MRQKSKNMKKPVLWSIFLILAVPMCKGQQRAIPLCNLLKTPNQYDHKLVETSGFIYADTHSTGIRETSCEGGIVIRYDLNAAPQGFVDGIEAKRGRLDNRPLKVTVKGRFHAHAHGPLGELRRLEVMKIIKWEFVDSRVPDP